MHTTFEYASNTYHILIDIIIMKITSETCLRKQITRIQYNMSVFRVFLFYFMF